MDGRFEAISVTVTVITRPKGSWQSSQAVRVDIFQTSFKSANITVIDAEQWNCSEPDWSL